MDECKNRAAGSLEWKEGEGDQKGDEEAIDAAWLTLKPKLGPKNWTVSESFTFRGFFSWGWEARKQYIQPEIDALKAEIWLCHGTLESRNGNIASILEASRSLKAENEKLRNDISTVRDILIEIYHPEIGSLRLTKEAKGVLDNMVAAMTAPDTKGE